jgi:hypothetical protein
MNTQVFFIMLVLLNFTLAYPSKTLTLEMTDTQKSMQEHLVKKGKMVCKEPEMKGEMLCKGKMTAKKGKDLRKLWKELMAETFSYIFLKTSSISFFLNLIALNAKRTNFIFSEPRMTRILTLRIYLIPLFSIFLLLIRTRHLFILINSSKF